MCALNVYFFFLFTLLKSCCLPVADDLMRSQNAICRPAFGVDFVCDKHVSLKGPCNFKYCMILYGEA